MAPEQHQVGPAGRDDTRRTHHDRRKPMTISRPDWAAVAAQAAAEKKGEDTVVLEVGQLLSITDAFVVTSGSNARQMRAIAVVIERLLKARGGPAPLSVEGLDDARWVLMDYGEFVVHVFLDEARHFYQLEQLWADAEQRSWEVAGAL